MQRNLWPVQNQQEVVPLLVNPPQGLVQVGEAGSPLEEPLKVSLQGRFALRRRRFAVGPQTLVILPNGVANAIHCLLFPWAQRNQLADRPLGVQPTQGVQQPQNLELPGIVAHQRLADVHLIVHQRAEQRRFGDDPPRFVAADFPGGQLSLPGFVAGKDADPLPYRAGQPCPQFQGNSLRFRIQQGILVPHVLLVRRPQELHEVHPALALRGGERGEQRVGDHRGVGVFSQVPGPRVVGLKIARHLPRRRQHSVLLLVELLVAVRQQAVDLAGRYVDAQVQQCFVDQRLGDAALMVQIKHVTAEPGPKMSLDVRRQRGRLVGAVRQQVTQPPIANIMGFDLHVLDHEVFVPVLLRALGELFQRHGDGLVNRQLARLLSFGGTGAFTLPLLFVRGIGVWSIQRAGPDCGPPWQPLQPVDLVAQLSILRPQLLDHSQQMIDQRGSLFRRHFHAGDRERPGFVHAQQKTPKPPSK